MTRLAALRAVARGPYALSILFLCLGTACLIGTAGRWEPVQRGLGRACANSLRAAGGGFVKAGQILGTRADLVPAPFRCALQELQDQVDALSIQDCLRALPPALATQLREEYWLDTAALIGSGSVAQVFAARQRGTGREVAIKIVRPGMRRLVLRDVRAMQRTARRLSRLPGLRRLPIALSVACCLRPIGLQCDMRREARLQAAARARYAVPAAVIIPEVIAVPHRHVLVMERISGLSKVAAGQGNDRIALDRASMLVFEMLFEGGLMHCDLHPGNLLMHPSGALVLLDWGMCAPISARDRLALARFFMALIASDAEAGMQVCLETGTPIAATVDEVGLLNAVAGLFDATSRAPVGDFELSSFAAALMRAQARHGLCATASFSLPIMALATFEGQLKELDPDADFQRSALPSVLRILETEAAA